MADLAAEPQPRDVLDTDAAGGLLIRGSALRMAGFVAGTALSVVGAAIVLRYLGPVEAGRYTTVMALIGIVSGVADSGTLNVAIREYAQRHGADREDALRALAGLRLALALGGASAAVLVALAAGYTDAMVAGTAIAGVGAVVQTQQGSLSVPLGGELQIGSIAAIDLLRTAVLTAALGVLALAGAGLATMLGAPLAAALATLALTVPLVRGRVPYRPGFDVRAWRALMADTLPYAVAYAVTTLYAYLAVLVLGGVASDTEVGEYAAAFRVFIVLSTIPALLVATAFPILARAARDDAQRLRYALQKLLDVAVLGGLLLALLTVLGAQTTIDVIGGEDYDGSAHVLRVQGAALGLSFVAAVASFALLSLRAHRQILRGSAAALVVGAVGVAVFGELEGAGGAAWGNVLGEGALALVLGIGLLRHPDAPRLTAHVVPAALLAVALAVGAALVVPGPEWAGATLAGLVYLATLVLTRALPEELLQAVRRR